MAHELPRLEAFTQRLAAFGQRLAAFSPAFGEVIATIGGKRFANGAFLSSRMSLTTESPIEAKALAFTPEFFRLPPVGARDPFFNYSRSQYYMESEGLIKLVRVRPRGKARGTVFVPYEQVAARIREAQNEQHSDIVANNGGEHSLGSP